MKFRLNECDCGTLHRKPMVVMYKAGRMLSYFARKFLLKTPFLSLPNILAGRRSRSPLRRLRLNSRGSLK